MSKILLVEDERDLSSQIRDWLAREHHMVEVVDKGHEALARLLAYDYDAVVLDWLLPGMSGLDICKTYRMRGGTAPILMLTAKSAVEDKELGLDAGADDYLCKPFNLKELSARIRALIRRASSMSGHMLTVGDLVLDSQSRRVTVKGEPVHLEPKEFNLLEFLLRNANRVFSAEALIARVWESDSNVSPDAIRTYIKGLRKKIDRPDAPSIITTVRGTGYRLEGQ